MNQQYVTRIKWYLQQAMRHASSAYYEVQEKYKDEIKNPVFLHHPTRRNSSWWALACENINKAKTYMQEYHISTNDLKPTLKPHELKMLETGNPVFVNSYFYKSEQELLDRMAEESALCNQQPDIPDQISLIDPQEVLQRQLRQLSEELQTLQNIHNKCPNQEMFNSTIQKLDQLVEENKHLSEQIKTLQAAKDELKDRLSWTEQELHKSAKLLQDHQNKYSKLRNNIHHQRATTESQFETIKDSHELLTEENYSLQSQVFTYQRIFKKLINILHDDQKDELNEIVNNLSIN
jgi:uncharacterized phage infection (PIP) family protein YhgE